MPGLCGFSISPDFADRAGTLLRKMQEELVYRPYHQCDSLFEDRNIAATRVHLGIVNSEKQPFCTDELSLWLDGEFYRKEKDDGESDIQVLASNYMENNLLSFLSGCNGLFSAVIYDKVKQHLFLITDRFGLKHLYLYSNPECIAWASELKPFRCIPSFSFTLNPDRISEFIQIGHLKDNETWFDSVTLLEPATVYMWDLKASNATLERYWNWNE